jgi:hypothetical protein
LALAKKSGCEAKAAAKQSKVKRSKAKQSKSTQSHVPITATAMAHQLQSKA